MRRFAIGLVVALSAGALVAVGTAAPVQASEEFAPGLYQYGPIPAGVTTITFDIYGAQGGKGIGPDKGAGTTTAGGKGGHVKLTVQVAEGDVFNMVVGGAGGDAGGGSGAPGGSGAVGQLEGGTGGNSTCCPGADDSDAGGGGGGSGVALQLAPDAVTLVGVAGGGGGGGGFSNAGVGGAGGGSGPGGGGGDGSGVGSGGGGGTSSGGGAGGTAQDTTTVDENGGDGDGELGNGGPGGNSYYSGGGGGGGGYFGGGGGGTGYLGGGGGGGGGLANVGGPISLNLAQDGVNPGDGKIIVTQNATSATKWVRVVAPNGGETLPRGQATRIRWKYTGFEGTTLTITLRRFGKLVRTIASTRAIGTSGAGSMSWTPPGDLAPGSGYRVRISVNGADPAAGDISNAAFTLT